MSQARGKGGLFLSLYVTVRAFKHVLACQPCVKKKKQKNKTVSDNVFLFKRGLGPSEPLRMACVMGKGTHARGDGGPCNPQPFLHLKLLLQKCSPAPSPLKSKAPV